MEVVLIVGAGPIGLACAISAKRRGLDPLVIDAGPIASSIARYPVGMTFFTTPERLEIGNHPMVCAGAKATREEALKYYRGVARAEGIRIRPYVRLTRAEGGGGRVRCALQHRLGQESLEVDRLVLATGYFDHPNRLDVPGEDLPHVSHYADEPHRSARQRIVIVGGKNSAVEHALACFRAEADVTLVYHRRDLRPTVKYWLRPDLENRIKAGEITAKWGSRVTRIDIDAVTIRTGIMGTERIPADRVYLLTGFHPDFELFRSIGIRLDSDDERPALDPETLETNIKGVYMAGSVASGRKISEVFIENGRYDGEKIFGDARARAAVDERARHEHRPVGE